ncbi:hypothetical protein DEHRE_00865 [Dehalobacter restrictus DSM 9455]|uniref:Uncharacterized protein n=1 Tax=Dehalobacter restrictus (strain DSM 9455 / PER-K23) TaxID=871738 RepID=A0ABM5P9A0_DEHRP|nr:hypothetical protein DEHRE_00865 [Dehalobacter restrictus DSM 9455]
MKWDTHSGWHIIIVTPQVVLCAKLPMVGQYKLYNKKIMMQ